MPAQLMRKYFVPMPDFSKAMWCEMLPTHARQRSRESARQEVLGQITGVIPANSMSIECARPVDATNAGAHHSGQPTRFVGGLTFGVECVQRCEILAL